MDEATKGFRRELQALVKDGVLASWERSRSGQWYITPGGTEKLILIGGPMQLSAFLTGVEVARGTLSERNERARRARRIDRTVQPA